MEMQHPPLMHSRGMNPPLQASRGGPKAWGSLGREEYTPNSTLSPMGHRAQPQQHPATTVPLQFLHLAGEIPSKDPVTTTLLSASDNTLRGGTIPILSHMGWHCHAHRNPDARGFGQGFSMAKGQHQPWQHHASLHLEVPVCGGTHGCHYLTA